MNGAGYNPEHPYDWLGAYLKDFDEFNPAYQVVNGLLDLRARRFTALASRFPYFPQKNHGNMGVAWSHGSQPGKFAVVNNDARFYTIDLWLIETSDADVRVVDLIGPAEKRFRRFLRLREPKEYGSLAVTYGDVSFVHGAATIDFAAETPKSPTPSYAEGTVRVALPAGTITGVKAR